MGGDREDAFDAGGKGEDLVGNFDAEDGSGMHEIGDDAEELDRIMNMFKDMIEVDDRKLSECGQIGVGVGDIDIQHGFGCVSGFKLGSKNIESVFFGFMEK